MTKKIRMLYKKTGELPIIRILDNMTKIKEQIVKGNFTMIRYDDFIIICETKKQNANFVPNIVLNLKNITGDFILIGYDPKQKDFRSLTMQEVFVYFENLERKSFNYNQYKQWLKKLNKVKKKYRKKNYSSNDDDNTELQKQKKNSNPNEQNTLNMILDIQKTILKHLT